jgi:glycosyltransferase involved in cell wall biosynthesis
MLMQVAVVIPPVVPDPGLTGHEGVHTVLQRICALMGEHGIAPRLIVPSEDRPRRPDGVWPVEMPKLARLDRTQPALAIDAATAQLTEALSGVDVCLVYDVLFDVYCLPIATALHAAAVATGCRLVFYSFECTWGPRLPGGFDWRRVKSAPFSTIATMASEHTLAFPARHTQAKIAAITGLPLHRWRLLPPVLDPRQESYLDPEIVRLWHERRLWRRDPVILLPALNRDNNNLDRALRIVAELVAAGGDPMLLLTYSDSDRWPGNRAHYAALTALAGELAVADHVLFLTSLRPEWSLGLPRHALMTLYHLCDLVLLPTDWEGFGLVAIEAALTRAPLLCTGLPVLREITGGHASYFDLEERDADIAARVREMTDGTAHRLRRAARSYLDVHDTFDRYLKPLLSGD